MSPYRFVPRAEPWAVPVCSLRLRDSRSRPPRRPLSCTQQLHGHHLWCEARSESFRATPALPLLRGAVCRRPRAARRGASTMGHV